MSAAFTLMLFCASAVQKASTMRDTLTLMPRTSGLSMQRHSAFRGARKPIVPWKTGFGGAAGVTAGVAALAPLADLAGVAAGFTAVASSSARASASRGGALLLSLNLCVFLTFLLLTFFLGAS